MRAAQKWLCLALATCAGSASAGNASLDWLSGRWCGGDAQRQIEEVWLAEAGGMLLGMSRTTNVGKPESFEFMRIVHDGKDATLHVQPDGAPPTVFIMAERGEGWIRWENPAHDFPNRIEYRREADALEAWIAGPGRDGKDLKIRFDYRRCGD